MEVTKPCRLKTLLKTSIVSIHLLFYILSNFTALIVKHISISGGYLYVASDNELHILHLENICKEDGQVLDASEGNAK